MTNVPLPAFGDEGFTSPEETAIRDGVFADINAAFGGNLNPSPSTPQGQLSTSFAAVIGAFNDLFVDFTNQVDPAYASGRMQDAIGRIYFLSRQGATPTVVTARCYGATGVTITVGALAKATDGTIYQALTSATIPVAGYVDVQFGALTPGPIACPAGSLNMIYRTIPGWDSVENLTDGTPGQEQENTADFEERRALSVAGNAVGILPAVRGAVLGVPGVVDAYVTENNTGSDVVVGSQTVLAHSIYVAVEGGTDEAVALAIWGKKPPGCAYSGSTTVTVEDDNSGYVTPPTYDVSFQRAAALAINVVVQIANRPDVPSDVAAQVQAAVAAKFPDLAKIGQTVFASSFVCPIGALGDWARIAAVTVNGVASVAAGINQFPTLGTVTVSLV
jgi:Uncharacterized homolog of phage Mu protein gp47